MCETLVRRVVGRRTRRALLGMLAAGTLSGCATTPFEQSAQPDERTFLLETNRAQLMARADMERYRCASSAIMHCDGSTGIYVMCSCPAAVPIL